MPAGGGVPEHYLGRINKVGELLGGRANPAHTAPPSKGQTHEL
jgi:hypothetical protein